MLFSLLLLFCPNLLDLDERRNVEEMQLKYLILLQKYLNKKYKDPFLLNVIFLLFSGMSFLLPPQ